MKPGDIVRHKPSGQIGPVKWVSSHPDATFIYLDLGEEIPQFREQECELVEEQDVLRETD